MTTLPRCICVLTLLVFCEGCLRVTTDITTFAELRQYRMDGKNELRVMTTDKSIYELQIFAVRDSLLEGSGTILTKEGHPTFKGEIPFSSVVYLQGRENSIGRTLAGLAIAGFVGVAAGGGGGQNGLHVYRPTSGSCPYVYAWDGHRYVLQGELFGTALGKALETTTACMLPATSPQGTTVHVRVANERPETHYIDAMRLLAFDAPEGSVVMLDNVQRAWPVMHPQSPLTGPAQLLSRDGVYWRSALRTTGLGDSYRDTIDMTFRRHDDTNEGSLIIHGINTQLGNAVYDMVFGYLDDEYLRFLDQLENDPECVQALRTWIDEASLTVEVWSGERWVSEGRVAPEAVATDIDRIVRVSAEGIAGDSIRIRLSSLADLWNLDAVALDWTPVQPLTPHQMAMRSAAHTAAGPVSERLSINDKDYTVLLPGEHIEMEFNRYPPSPGRTVAYAVEATGYLYEWQPSNDSSWSSPFPIVTSGSGLSDRMEVVNFLIRHRELVLAFVYERWKTIRSSDPG